MHKFPRWRDVRERLSDSSCATNENFNEVVYFLSRATIPRSIIKKRKKKKFSRWRILIDKNQIDKSTRTRDASLCASKTTVTSRSRIYTHFLAYQEKKGKNKDRYSNHRVNPILRSYNSILARRVESDTTRSKDRARNKPKRQKEKYKVGGDTKRKKEEKKEKLNKIPRPLPILEKARVSSILPVSHAIPGASDTPCIRRVRVLSYEKFRCVYAWMSFPARGNRRRGAIGGSKLAREAVSPRGCGGAAGPVGGVCEGARRVGHGGSKGK